MRSLHTPQQETNVAYNPGVSYRGGEFIAQGISQAGNAISAGLQRYAQNREESAALDMSFQTRAQPLLEEMQKFSAKDGQVSPAAGLVDKGADWHKFSSSQKKAFLADVVIMGDKQDRARRQQQEDDFRKAAQQFQHDQFTEQKKQNQTANDRTYTQDALNALDRHRQAMRNLDADRRDDARLSLAQQGYEATQARFGRQEQESETQRGAVGGFLRDFNQFAEGPKFNGTGMQRPMSQFEAYRQAAGANPRAFTPQMMDDLGRMAVSEDRLSQSALKSFSPTLGTKSVTLADGRVVEVPYGTTSAGGVDWMPQTLTQSGGKALPPVVMTVPGATPGSSTRVPMTAEQYTAYQAANPPPAELKKRGDRAALEEELRQHETALKAGNDDRYGFGNAYSRQNRVVELKRKLAELGAGPAPAASSPGRGQAIRYKLVNGQLVSE